MCRLAIESNSRWAVRGTRNRSPRHAMIRFTLVGLTIANCVACASNHCSSSADLYATAVSPDGSWSVYLYRQWDPDVVVTLTIKGNRGGAELYSEVIGRLDAWSDVEAEFGDVFITNEIAGAGPIGGDRLNPTLYHIVRKADLGPHGE